MSDQHAFSLYLNNRPGVLNRVALIFSRRGWNIENISISPAEDGRFARCNLVAAGEIDGLRNMVAQLSKLVDVIAARHEILDDRVLSREVVLIKVRFDAEVTTDVERIARELDCDVVDTSGGSAVLQFVGEHAEIDEVRNKVGEHFKVLDVVRSGAISMHRTENDADDISNQTPGIVVTAENDGPDRGVVR